MSEAPERIWATVNGLRTGMPGAHSWLIGGWEARAKQSERETEYVRKDLFDAVKAERDALEARLRAELAEARESAQSAHAVGFAAAIEAAGQVAEDWFYDPEEDDVTDVRLSIDIRALTPPDITAAAARVLLANWHPANVKQMIAPDQVPFYAALRALAEVKP